MALITVTTHFWGQKYSPAYVDRLAVGVARHLKQPHRFVVITDEPGKCDPRHTSWGIPEEDRYLLDVKGCFCRLRLFDPAWQAQWGIEPGDRIVSMDLDAVVTGPLDPLFDRPEPFVILQGANSSNPCPYNGSLWQLRAGAYPEVWRSFSLKAAWFAPVASFPDDQGWFWHKMPRASGWKAGTESGVLAFRKPGWPEGNTLPAGARFVAFPGFRDPAQFVDLPWIKQHWLGE